MGRMHAQSLYRRTDLVSGVEVSCWGHGPLREDAATFAQLVISRNIFLDFFFKADPDFYFKTPNLKIFAIYFLERPMLKFHFSSD